MARRYAFSRHGKLQIGQLTCEIQHSFLSFPELLQFTICNLLLSPPNFYWQHFLERSFPARKLPSEKYDVLPQHEDGIELDKMPGTASETDVDSNVSPKLNWKNTAIKWFIDCITMGALLNTVAFLIVMGLLKGRTIEQIGTAIRTVSPCSPKAGPCLRL